MFGKQDVGFRGRGQTLRPTTKAQMANCAGKGVRAVAVTRESTGNNRPVSAGPSSGKARPVCYLVPGSLVPSLDEKKTESGSPTQSVRHRDRRWNSASPLFPTFPKVKARLTPYTEPDSAKHATGAANRFSPRADPPDPRSRPKGRVSRGSGMRG